MADSIFIVRLFEKTAVFIYLASSDKLAKRHAGSIAYFSVSGVTSVLDSVQGFQYSKKLGCEFFALTAKKSSLCYSRITCFDL